MKIRQKVNSGLHWTTVITEKTLLAVIGILTLFAAGTYVHNMYLLSTIELADLFMLFIYVEIIGMVGAFYQTQRIPVTLPIIIAITALCRLIVMQSKDMEATTVILEAGAILILSGAAYLMSLKDKLSLEKLQNKVDIGHKK